MLIMHLPVIQLLNAESLRLNAPLSVIAVFHVGVPIVGLSDMVKPWRELGGCGTVRLHQISDVLFHKRLCRGA